MMNYEEILRYIYAIPMFQKVGASAYNPSLDKTKMLCDFLGNPQNRFQSVHIAGTNGKGSSSTMLAEIFIQAGYKTAIYTSPHMIDYRERIVVDKEMIKESEVIEFMEIALQEIDRLKPSFFELTTVLAFWLFAKREVDIAIIETGLGGRIDSTNVINPLLSLITNIGSDHEAILGDTLEKIAAEKGGIIKYSTDIVISEKQPFSEAIFRELAKKNSSKIYFAQDNYSVNKVCYNNGFQHIEILYKDEITSFKMQLLGEYQQKNLLGVLQAVELIRESKLFDIPMQAVVSGLEKCTIRGRWQKILDKPYVVCDVGHNEDGIRAVVKMLNSCSYKRLFIVIGFMADKSIDNILPLLPKNAAYIFTKADSERAMDDQELQSKAYEHSLLGICEPNIATAYEMALEEATEDDMIFIGGSSYVVAQLLESI